MEWIPEPDSELVGWWGSKTTSQGERKDLWTALILAFWCLWKHRNDVVFNGVAPEVRAIQRAISMVADSWRRAGLPRG